MLILQETGLDLFTAGGQSGALGRSAPEGLHGGAAWNGGTARPATSSKPARTFARGAELVGRVTHVRDGDTIEVAEVPVRIANLDCAERGTAAGTRATQRMRELSGLGPMTCRLEGRTSYDRQVGVCALPDGRDLGEVLIAEAICARWRW